MLARKNDDEIVHFELTREEADKVKKLLELEEKREIEEQERLEKDNNPPFVQIYKGVGLKALQWLIKENGLASAILMFFMENMNNRNGVVCSQQLLVDEFEKSRQTIYKAVKFLEKHNFINIGKIGTANAYIINPELAFQDKNSKKKYVSFDGTILLSKEENKQLFSKQTYDNVKILKDKKSP
ncbi:replication protein (RepL) [Bacillus sp. OV322]|uniref:replication/maintenance protein RepL n=1 Tax=Bacillus sp. OV322 TaxID=1882764 RepID=UPI0008EC1C47|nr:replication/maintenance protein RepL [Bacillus sp. OV322]SFD03898.1 replication protein (RepL) [Bacillus sp. OV322]